VRKSAVGFLIMMLFLGLYSLTTAVASPKVLMDGRQLQFSIQPVTDNGITLAPLRAVGESIGATITWDAGMQNATAAKDDTTVTFSLGSTDAVVNGNVESQSVPTMVKDGVILVPLRFLAEKFGAAVQWDPDQELISIRSALPDSINPVPMGQSYLTAGGFEIKIDKVLEGAAAWSMIRDTRISPDPPASDMKYVVVTCSIKDVFAPLEPVSPGFFPSLSGSSKQIYSASDSLIYLPLSRTYHEFSPEKYAGGPAACTSVFYVPANESELRLIICDSVNLDKVYFEIH